MGEEETVVQPEIPAQVRLHITKAVVVFQVDLLDTEGRVVEMREARTVVCEAAFKEANLVEMAKQVTLTPQQT